MKYFAQIMALVIVLGVFTTLAKAAQQDNSAPQATRSQTDRERKELERQRKREEKEAAKRQQEEAGVRCARVRKKG
jgi:hypothetical protein